MLLFEDLEIDTALAERRRGLRVTQERPVRVFEPAAACFFGGRTRDVSSTGLQLTFDAAVDLCPGRLINIAVGCTVSGNPLANRRAMIPACVVWTRLDAEDGFAVGVEFLSNITAFAGAA